MSKVYKTLHHVSHFKHVHLFRSQFSTTTTASAESEFQTTTKLSWRRQVGSLWRSIGMTNKDADMMMKRGENKPLFRKHNVLSVRISELRELFPNANIPRMIRVMPSLLSDEVHRHLVDKRYVLDRALINFDIDRLITEHPFILSKDSDFIGRNRDNLKELFRINDTEFKLMLDAQPQIIMFDARRTISVKYQLIAQYFQHRIESEMDRIHKTYNELDDGINTESDIEFDADRSDDDSDNDSDRDLDSSFTSLPSLDSIHSFHFEDGINSKSLKAMERKISKSESDKLKWTVIRNPELLLMGWDRFGRLEFVMNDRSLNEHKLSVQRLMELEAKRMIRKFPEYSGYLMDRLESDGGCDREKLEPLSIEELEEAMGELICLEHYPRSSEVDEQIMDLEEEEEEEESDDEENQDETPQIDTK